MSKSRTRKVFFSCALSVILIFSSVFTAFANGIHLELIPKQSHPITRYITEVVNYGETEKILGDN